MVASLSPSAVVVPYTKYLKELEGHLRRNSEDIGTLSIKVQSIPLHIEERDLEAFRQAQVYRINKHPSFNELVAEEIEMIDSFNELFVRGKKEQAIMLAWVRYCYFRAAYRRQARRYP
ncbi:hypothetical protein IKG10_01405 [Candidatus Saccharibacteria bacterium]|nr:hypothetical protein [Candidatus Saccharibacteria bacterium]